MVRKAIQGVTQLSIKLQPHSLLSEEIWKISITLASPRCCNALSSVRETLKHNLKFDEQTAEKRDVPELDIVQGEKAEVDLLQDVAAPHGSLYSTWADLLFTASEPVFGFWIHSTSRDLWQSPISDHICTVHCGASKKWLLEPTRSWEIDSRRSMGNAAPPPARGDKGVDGISPHGLSGPGEITSDVIGSSIFCNRTQKG